METVQEDEVINTKESTENDGPPPLKERNDEDESSVDSDEEK